MDECCTVNLTVRYLTKKWTLLIILELFKGDNYTRRFSELKDRLPEIKGPFRAAAGTGGRGDCIEKG